MTKTLHLGVVDVPYSEPPSEKPREKSDRSRTTGEVAEYLENKYHIMEHFYEIHKKQIGDAIANSVAGALETMLMTSSPPALDINATAMGVIEKDFRNFLALKELDGLGYPGIPTRASIEGVSHRFKSRRGPPGRPSFIDTGLYQKSFKAWVD